MSWKLRLSDEANRLRRRVRRTLRERGWQVRRRDWNLDFDTFLPALFDHLGVDCVLDVGANVGQYGVQLREWGYRGRIISFEPVAASFRELQRRAAADRDWQACRFALGSRSSQAEINVTRGTDLSSFHAPNRYGQQMLEGAEIDRTETVDVCRLDEIFDEVTRPRDPRRVYLKLDTQGWDLEVVRGAVGCLDRIVALQSELSLTAIYEQMPDFAEALGLYRDLGFVPSAVFPVTRAADWRLLEVDCVLVRAVPPLPMGSLPHVDRHA